MRVEIKDESVLEGCVLVTFYTVRDGIELSDLYTMPADTAEQIKHAVEAVEDFKHAVALFKDEMKDVGRT